MLDTVEVKHYYTNPLSEADILDLGAIRLSRYRLRTYGLSPEPDKPLPAITFRFTPDGIMHVSARFSVAKVRFGHNAQLPLEPEALEGLGFASNNIEARTGLEFKWQSATVNEAHFARDVQLGEAGVYRAVEVLSKLKMAGLRKTLWNDTTICFENKSLRIRIYPKLQEVLASNAGNAAAVEAARGKLRFEYCLLKKYSIDSHVKRLGMADSTASNLFKESVTDALLSQLFRELGFPEILTNDRSSLVTLCEHYPVRKAMKLSGFLEMVRIRGEHFYRDSTIGFSKDSYFYARRQCIRAGVWKVGDSLE